MAKTDDPVAKILRTYLTTCSGCAKPMIWADKAVPAGEKPVKIPIDTKPACYVLFLDRENGEKLKCLTAREFRGMVQSITLKNGKTIDADRLLGWFVTHFATCANVARFSSSNHPKE